MNKLTQLSTDIIESVTSPYCPTEIYCLNRYYRKASIFSSTINIGDKFNWLNNACKYNLLDCISLFIESKFNVNYKNNECLSTCVVYNSIDSFKLLVSSGLVNICANNNILNNIYSYDRVDIFVILLNLTHVPWDINNLRRVIMNAKEQIIIYLLKQPNVLKMITPKISIEILGKAVEMNNSYLVKFLLAIFDYNDLCGEVCSIVRSSYMKGRYGIVVILIDELGREVIDSDIYEWAAEDNNIDVCLSINEYDNSCYDHAVSFRNDDLAKLLLKPAWKLPYEDKRFLGLWFEDACCKQMYSLAKRMIKYGYANNCGGYISFDDMLNLLKTVALQGNQELMERLLKEYSCLYWDRWEFIEALTKQSWFDRSKETMKDLQ